MTKRKKASKRLSMKTIEVTRVSTGKYLTPTSRGAKVLRPGMTLSSLFKRRKKRR